MSKRKLVSKAVADIGDFFYKAKERMLTDRYLLFENFSTVPACAGPSIGGMAVWAFHTGKLPSSRTPSRRIMEWNSVEITKSRGGSKHELSLKDAQKEISRLLGAKHSSHQHLTYEAIRLCGSYTEASEYTLHMIAGSMAEDFFFRQAESLHDIYASTPKKEFEDMHELKRALEPNEPPSFVKRIFMGIAKFWRKILGGSEKDSINRPYFAHFHDPSRKPGDEGLNLFDGDLRFQSAFDRIQSYWDTASDYYIDGDKPRAFCALGHILHLVQDMHVPAHVHNDVHGPNLILGKPDSLEEWCILADYPHLERPGNKENIRIWDNGPIEPPKPDVDWNRGNVGDRMKAFLNACVVKTKTFRSVDAKGTADGQKKEGVLSNEECFDQASCLIPLAISNSAQLIANFIEYHREK